MSFLFNAAAAVVVVTIEVTYTHTGAFTIDVVTFARWFYNFSSSSFSYNNVFFDTVMLCQKLKCTKLNELYIKRQVKKTFFRSKNFFLLSLRESLNQNQSFVVQINKISYDSFQVKLLQVK